MLIEIAQAPEGYVQQPPTSEGRARRFLGQLVTLGAVRIDAGRVHLINPELVAADGKLDADILTQLLERAPGGKAALDLLQAVPSASNREIGEAIRDAYQVRWADGTTEGVGKQFRSWARYVGIKRKPARPRGSVEGRP